MFFSIQEKIKPAAKNPLYSPWLAASTLVSSANSFDFKPKVLMPFGVVHKNISSTKKYKCSMATNTIKIIETVFILYSFIKVTALSTSDTGNLQALFTHT